MPSLELALLLAAVGVAAFPCWRYSAGWSYWPSVSAGTLLLVVAVLAVAGIPGAPDNRANAPSKPSRTTAAATAALSAPTPNVARQASMPMRSTEVVD